MKLNRENKLLIGLCTAAAILIAKLFSIQILDEDYKMDARNNSMVYTTIYPTRGIPETIKERLREALPKLDRADNDFHEAYACGREYRHTTVFRNKPGEEEQKEKFGMKHLREEMLRGLAFHLPLFLLLLITWGIYALASS